MKNIILGTVIGLTLFACGTENNKKGDQTKMNQSNQEIFDTKLKEVCNCFDANMDNLPEYKKCNEIIEQTRKLIGNDEALFEEFVDRMVECDTYLSNHSVH